MVIKLLQAFDIIKIYQHMRAFFGSYFNARYAENIFVAVDFDGTFDGIMVGLP